ncbi:MAG: hypothetical protein AB1689_29225, partial [Thermodesulfobacteriota bacterium]
EAGRAACPCAGCATPSAYRACARETVRASIASGVLRKQCRGEVMRFANRSTCGAKEGSVPCCTTSAAGRESCRIVADPARCRAPRGGEARIGASESCWDACLPLPSATPAVTPTPVVTPTPASGGRCCGCGCAPPYYLNCPFSQHQCSVPAPDATVEEECDAFDIPGQLDCEFFTTCNGTSGGIWFPYCTGVG